MKTCAICGGRVEDRHAICSACVEKANDVDVYGLVEDALGAPKHDSSKWVTWLCPFHSEKRDGAFHVDKQRNFYHCFACGKNGGAISWMMKYGGLSFVDSVKALLGVSTASNLNPKPRKVRKAPVPKTPEWLLSGENYVNQWASSKYVMDAWARYKNVPEEIIKARRYGWGRLPEYSSHCDQQRLIVPFISGGRVIGVRARLLDVTREKCPHRRDDICERLSHKGKKYKCAKWLSPKMPNMPLYNGARLLPQDATDKRARGLFLCDRIDSASARGAILHIVENPVDADLFEYRFRDAVGVDLLAVATCGVTVWRDEWTKSLDEISPLQIQVVYDNDMAGNGNTREAREAYERKYAGTGRKPPMCGLKLVQRLRGHGLPAYLFNWSGAEAGADVGSYL